MMLKFTSPEREAYYEEMDKAMSDGDMEKYKEIYQSYTDFVKKEYQKERAEYLEIFGIDIDKYPDYSYRLFYDLEAAKEELYGKR